MKRLDKPAQQCSHVQAAAERERRRAEEEERAAVLAAVQEVERAERQREAETAARAQTVQQVSVSLWGTRCMMHTGPTHASASSVVNAYHDYILKAGEAQYSTTFGLCQHSTWF